MGILLQIINDDIQKRLSPWRDQLGKTNVKLTLRSGSKKIKNEKHFTFRKLSTVPEKKG